MASDKTGTRIMAIILATLVQDEARLNDLTDLRPNITRTPRRPLTVAVSCGQVGSF
jgi:hypothetical protein